MKKFCSPDTDDKRIEYAKALLEEDGYSLVEKEENADFILLGVNPKSDFSHFDKPVFAGNVEEKNGVFDYTKREEFALKNAYLTAEAALAVAIENSDLSLVNSSVLICGFGRIGRALKRYLEPFSRDITVCVRNENSAALARCENAKTIGFEGLKNCSDYDFIFNTVPQPVFNETELKSIKKDALLIDLASFPGGVDTHYAKLLGINLITARGLPGKYSPKSAGEILAHTVIKILKEEGL